MKKLMLIVGCFIIGLLIGATYVALGYERTGANTTGAAAAPVLPTTETDASVVAQGKVVPVQSVALNFPAKSTVSENVVAEVLVQEGNTVEQGAPLARVDTRDLQLRVEAAQAALAKARADYARLQAEVAGDAALAGAAAQIQQAEVALKREELALDLATLRAPRAGTVVDVNLEVGEVPSMAEPAIVMADFSAWQIETDGLTELSVMRIQEGDPVNITFDALPGLTIPGKVARVKAIGQTTPDGTSTTYTVIISPDQQDQRFHWNMSASVAFVPSE